MTNPFEILYPGVTNQDLLETVTHGPDACRRMWIETVAESLYHACLISPRGSDVLPDVFLVAVNAFWSSESNEDEDYIEDVIWESFTDNRDSDRKLALAIYYAMTAARDD